MLERAHQAQACCGVAAAKPTRNLVIRQLINQAKRQDALLGGRELAKCITHALRVNGGSNAIVDGVELVVVRVDGHTEPLASPRLNAGSLTVPPQLVVRDAEQPRGGRAVPIAARDDFAFGPLLGRPDAERVLKQIAGITVGTALAGGPPCRSQRAGLPHWAPASDTSVKARLGERVHHTGWR